MSNEESRRVPFHLNCLGVAGPPVESNNLAPKYPDGNPKTAFGIAKPSTHAIPPVAILVLGQAMTEGKRKYGLTNWRDEPVSASTYYDAAMRHMLAWWDGQNLDPDASIHHLGMVMACMAIIIDAQYHGMLDDRPRVDGTAARFIQEHIEKGKPADV